MWEPRRLATLWAFTACYRDSFTLPLPLFYISLFQKSNALPHFVGYNFFNVPLISTFFTIRWILKRWCVCFPADVLYYILWHFLSSTAQEFIFFSSTVLPVAGARVLPILQALGTSDVCCATSSNDSKRRKTNRAFGCCHFGGRKMFVLLNTYF
jgi:hypothetical protein